MYVAVCFFLLFAYRLLTTNSIIGEKEIIKTDGNICDMCKKFQTAAISYCAINYYYYYL